jgi:hypothetical protein
MPHGARYVNWHRLLYILRIFLLILRTFSFVRK